MQVRSNDPTEVRETYLTRGRSVAAHEVPMLDAPYHAHPCFAHVAARN
jgi:hypothetical protein